MKDFNEVKSEVFSRSAKYFSIRKKRIQTAIVCVVLLISFSAFEIFPTLVLVKSNMASDNAPADAVSREDIKNYEEADNSPKYPGQTPHYGCYSGGYEDKYYFTLWQTVSITGNGYELSFTDSDDVLKIAEIVSALKGFTLSEGKKVVDEPFSDNATLVITLKNQSEVSTVKLFGDYFYYDGYGWHNVKDFKNIILSEKRESSVEGDSSVKDFATIQDFFESILDGLTK